MKWIISGMILVATFLSVIAVHTLPEKSVDGIVQLTWATDDNPARKEQMDLFRKWHLEKFGEKIDIRIDPSNYDISKVVVQSLAGAGPDIFDFYGSQTLSRYVKSGVLLDVTEPAKQRGFGAEIVWQGYRSSFVFEGRQYGFPDNVINHVIVFHKDVFDKLGIAYPSNDWTWDDFIEIGKKLTFIDSEGKKHYAMATLGDELTIVHQYDGQLFSPEGTHCIINSQEALAGLQLCRDLRTKHNIVPTAAQMASQASTGGWGSGDLNIFATKNFGMSIAGRYWFIGFERDARQHLAQGLELPYDLGVVELPRGTQKFDIGGARCTGISRISKNRKYALRFLEFLATKRFNKQINRSFDGIAPVMKFSKGPEGIADGPAPLQGLEVANDSAWIRGLEYTHELRMSPFIEPHHALRFWYESCRLMQSDVITPKEALERAEKLINEQIQINISKDDKLRARYEKALSKENEAGV